MNGRSGLESVEQFWARCRSDLDHLPEEMPEAWAFGATRAHADELLRLVLDGFKTGTTASLWDHETTGEAVPEPGMLSIVLDGMGVPRALLETTEVQIVPFGEVGVEHAFAEGEGDRTLEYWRRAHEWFWREHSENPRGFEPDMPVVCERFRLLRAESAT